jgi:radical SAM protein with 4Fe4S-binding SPASM domain
MKEPAMYIANPELTCVMNTTEDRAYLAFSNGLCDIANGDALDLVLADDPAWQSDPDYASFLDAARRAEWLVDAGMAGSRPKPTLRRIATDFHLRRLQYEINLTCNLECAHCYCSSSPRAPRGESTAFVESIVDQAAAMGVLFFDVTGGEPLIRGDVYDILARIKQRGMLSSLYTNCTLVDDQVAARLADIGVPAVNTSLDAFSPELHDEIRGKRRAFERTIRGIKELKAVGIRVAVTFCANKRNWHEAEPLTKWLEQELGVDVRVDRVIPAGRVVETENSIALTNEEFYRLVRSLQKTTKAQAAKVCDSPTLLGTRGAIEPWCGVGASYLFLKHDGRAALCPTMTEAESPDFVQADLKKMSLEEAWLRHPTFQRYRNVQCRNIGHCPAAETCRGGCRSNAYLIHGTSDSPDEFECNDHKNTGPEYVRFLELYAKADAERGITRARPRERRMLPMVQARG